MTEEERVRLRFEYTDSVRNIQAFIWLPSFESFSANWISVHLIYGDPRDLFV